IGPTKDGSATVTQTAAATAPSITYLKHNAADDLLASIGPASLVANLPSNLLPQTGMQFYADPYLEQQLLTQAALKQTGQAWFINGLAQDDKTKMSLADEQKAILYQNAIAWADKNQVTLGTALTDQQIAALDAPMLWYVQQAVPDPSCAGLPTCGTVSVLMPQVYLPTASQSQLAKQEGGLIQGQTVTLDVSNTLTNTGSIIANQLDLKAKELVNEARSVDIGYATNKVEGGWINVYGTQVQPGGLISATNLNIDASTVHSIGGQFQVLNADGNVDEAKSAQLIADLGKKLGVNYTSQTVADDIHQDFMKDTSGPGEVGMVVAVIAAIAIACFAGPAILGAVNGMMGASAATVAAANAAGGALVASAVAAPSLAATAVAAGLTAMTSAAASQLITTGKLDGGELLKAGAVGALTAGITTGLANSGALASTGTWSGQVVNAAERAVINTTVQTAVYGGSFKTALIDNLAGTESAVGANFIGSAFAQTDFNQLNQNTPNPLQVLAHAALGCATAAVKGGDCSSGAIGGAVAATAAPLVDQYITTGNSTLNNFLTESTALAATGLVAGATGKDVSTALTAAQNTDENNRQLHDQEKEWLKTKQSLLLAQGDDGLRQIQLEVAASDKVNYVPSRDGPSNVTQMAETLGMTYAELSAYAKSQPGYDEAVKQVNAATTPAYMTTCESGCLVKKVDAQPVFSYTPQDEAADSHRMVEQSQIDSLVAQGWSRDWATSVVKSNSTVGIVMGSIAGTKAIDTARPIDEPTLPNGYNGKVVADTPVVVKPVEEVAPPWTGSGPAKGVLGVNPDTASVAALKNYSPKQGMIEYVFDPSTSTFVVGRPDPFLSGYSPHENLSVTIGGDPNTVVGGMFKRSISGEILTNEFSGHYWKNWTPAVRQQFQQFMQSKDLPVIHTEGM
ncbi:DUF637 domain-containing protein, partial [Andreprevotia chitinilytica]|uniref:DUF637 domain-containing protein n=1 Tax=Andreprevotia chitinilytica TaxID=396808 RepID=UPI001B808289